MKVTTNDKAKCDIFKKNFLIGVPKITN